MPPEETIRKLLADALVAAEAQHSIAPPLICDADWNELARQLDAISKALEQ